MTVLETVLTYVVPVVGGCLLIAVPIVAPRMRRRPRYRVGQPWPYQPIWWTAEPGAAQLPTAHVATDERGGARGIW